MRVRPTGQSEYHNGNEVLRYGRDISRNTNVAVWYHDGIRGTDEPTWAMDTEVEFKISVSVDLILVADQQRNELFAIDASEFSHHTDELGGREQYVARASDEHVRSLGDPSAHLQGNLWIESGNEVDENYHQEAGH